MVMTLQQRTLKRALDLLLGVIGLIICTIPIAVVAFLVKLSSNGPIFYRQQRIGRFGEKFILYKFRSMYENSVRYGFVTTSNDSRITPIGRWLRRFKIDELPQLWNIVRGDMSFVGHRPDVHGYADMLTGEERKILEMRPGITGPASLCFRAEERFLSSVENPQQYNDEVIWPAKVKINLTYQYNWCFWKDIGYILVTLCPVLDTFLFVNRDIPDNVTVAGVPAKAIGDR